MRKFSTKALMTAAMLGTFFGALTVPAAAQTATPWS